MTVFYTMSGRKTKMKLKELRQLNNLTQKELAQHLNTSEVNYNRYELEKVEPSIKTLINLADYYNVSLDYLVGRHFKDDLGYIEPKDYQYVKHFLELNDNIKNKIIGMSYTIEQMEK